MQKKIELPLHLCQVLEEELENLPGAPPAGEAEDYIYAPAARDEEGEAGATPSSGRRRVRVTVRDDWGFHDGHVKDVKWLAAVLRHAAEDWSVACEGRAEPDEDELCEEPDLYTFLAFRYRGLWDAAHAPGGAPADVKTLFNRILRDEDERGAPNPAGWAVFSECRLSRLAMQKAMLRKETLALLELRAERGGGADYEGEAEARADRARGGAVEGRFARTDLARFRRLLLEDAFPGALRRVYDLRIGRAVRRQHAAGRSALCLSGGGIRSGTFALGVIQSLARRRLLDRFDYLSTVSGGGYIGGWLTAWIHRHPYGLAGVIKDLSGETRASKLEPEPEPLRHLRDYSNFITPRAGLLSADTWTFVVIYLRNLLLNWVVLIPLLASVLMVPRVANAVILAEPSWRMLAGLVLLSAFGVFLLKPGRKTLLGIALFAAPALAIIAGARLGSRWGIDVRGANHVSNILGAMLIGGTLLGGYVIAYMRLHRPSNSGAIRPGSFWDTHRDQNSFLWLGLLPLTAAAMVLTAFWAWFRHASGVSSEKAVVGVKLFGFSVGGEFTAFIIYGVAVGLTSWLFYILFAGLSWTGATRREVTRRYRHGQGPRAMFTEAVKRKVFTGIVNNTAHELFVSVFTNVIGAVLLYVAAVKVPLFYDPVVEPLARTVYKDGAVSELLPYGQWSGAELYTWLAFPAYLLVFFLGITLYTGFTSRRSESAPGERAGSGWRALGLPRLFDMIRIEDEDREWLARASAWVFIAAGGWLYLGGLILFGPLLFVKLGTWLAGLGGLSGLLSLLGGRSSLTPGNSKEEAQAGLLKTLGVNLIVVASFVFFSCIVIAISLLAGTFVVWLASTFFTPSFAETLGMSARHFELFRDAYPFQSAENVFRVLHFPSWLYLMLAALGLQVFGRFFGGTVNLNKFSLHAGYRDRIIRAFLGASRLRGERKADPFTGFDPRDNLHLQELRPQLLRESDFREPNALQAFVAELNKPAEARHPIARFLRERIEQTNGDALRYFKDPPARIELTPSFRSALFGDLNRILQDEYIPPAPDGADETDGSARIRRNRERLKAAFDYIEDPPPPYRLMHVVNMALNLVGGDRLAWQQRRAESFTATPMHSGSLFVGYRRTRDYGGKNGVSLGTAVAISGAAASSNMGYFSPSVFVTFVLTFFNARLGWWLGNPGAYGADTFFRSHPQSALSPIIDEAFGLTDDENPYVLLSDGGHFENLGLYEMIVRRCRNIIVVDGSADPSGAYDDLGGAVRKIRIDFGVPIEFPALFPILSRPESEKKRGDYFVVGDIHYEAVDDTEGEFDYLAEDGSGRTLNRLTGKLIYIKPAIYGGEPRDVFNYAKGDPSFPHESTADQFFDEPQFESHRILGAHILDQLLGADVMSIVPGPDAINQLVRQLEEGARAKAAKEARAESGDHGGERRQDGGAVDEEEDEAPGG